MTILGKDGSQLPSYFAPSWVKGGVARNDKHHCIYFIRHHSIGKIDRCIISTKLYKASLLKTSHELHVLYTYVYNMIYELAHPN